MHDFWWIKVLKKLSYWVKVTQQKRKQLYHCLSTSAAGSVWKRSMNMWTWFWKNKTGNPLKAKFPFTSIRVRATVVIRRRALSFGERSGQALVSVGFVATISNKIVETLYTNRVTSENITIHTPPLSPPFKVGVFVVF